MKYRIRWLKDNFEDSVELEGPNLHHITKQLTDVIMERGLHYVEIQAEPVEDAGVAQP